MKFVHSDFRLFEFLEIIVLGGGNFKSPFTCIISFISTKVFTYSKICLQLGASLVAQMVKNLPAMQETQVQSLGWEDLLEKGMATHSSILAWRIPWTEEPGGYSPWGNKELDKTE